MSLTLQIAKLQDAPEIAALRNTAADDLTHRFGKGHWSGQTTERGVHYAMRISTVFIAKQRNKIIATLTLGTRKPWAIDKSYFTNCQKPLYLTSMAVLPKRQHEGLGRRCLAAALKIARNWPADCIRLDAYDHPQAGAGGFYRNCGYREVGRATYRTVPLIYFELLLS